MGSMLPMCWHRDLLLGVRSRMCLHVLCIVEARAVKAVNYGMAQETGSVCMMVEVVEVQAVGVNLMAIAGSRGWTVCSPVAVVNLAATATETETLLCEVERRRN